ncbi:FMRFamide receptor-like [Gigantopelta aegis]|uniref:FMRFamide receptor-like n=1 Tax=Gigantopelta aegis TaxID=1735272 RepID=UPI001B889BCC|nr:FMRFamide receptor-like [Gigantopelta aegis]
MNLEMLGLADQENATIHMGMITDQVLNSNRSFPSLNALTVDSMSNPAYVIMSRVQTVLVPVICVVGIIGNILASGTFLSPVMRNMSCCLYLAAKSLCDIGFLVSLFVIWLYRLRVTFLLVEGVCQMNIFMTYVCGFLSVWFVVIITCENFIRISQHSKVPVLCTRKIALIVISVIVCFGLILCSFTLWTTGIVSTEETSYCTSLIKFADMLMVMTYVDTALTLVLPSLIIVFLVLAIMVSSYKAFQRNKRLRGTGQKRHRRYTTPESKVTRFLFALSLIFFLLHAPSHIIRIKLIVQHNFENPYPSLVDLILQRVFELLFCCSFSVNCLLYYVFGKNFRKVFKKMYMTHCSRQDTSSNMTYTIVQIGKTGQSIVRNLSLK